MVIDVITSFRLFTISR